MKKSDGRKIKGHYLVDGKVYTNLKAVSTAYSVNIDALRARLRFGMSFEDAITSIKAGDRNYWVKKGPPVTINGYTYPSAKVAAKELGITRKSLNRILAGKSYLGPDGKVFAASRAFILNGVAYPSLKHAATAIGIGRSLLKRCIASGISDFETLKNEKLLKRKMAQELMGELYCITNLKTKRRYIGITLVSSKGRLQHHLKEAAAGRNNMTEDLNLYGPESFRLRVLKRALAADLKVLEKHYIEKWNTQDYRVGYNRNPGGTLNEQHLSTTIKYKGVVYKNLRALCNAYGITLPRTRRLLQDGYTVHRAVREGLRWCSLTEQERRRETNARRKSAILVRVKGLGTVTLKVACSHLNLCYDVVGRRVRQGMSPSQAIKIPTESPYEG